MKDKAKGKNQGRGHFLVPKLALGVALLLPAALWGEVHQVVATEYYHTFAKGNPVFKRIKPGDTVITKTLDANGQDDKDVRRHPAEFSNPLTGPFFVEGAEPGDALLVHFRRMKMNRNWGWTNYRLGLFSLTADYAETIYSNRYKDGLVHPGHANQVPWELDLQQNTVRLKEPASQRVRFEFPAQTMLGCVGVAAADDFAPTSAISGPYGGNMDYNQVAEGATVILPVFHPGGLLYMGDGHALQADGEPTGTGIETSLDVEFTVDLRKNARVTGPRLETNEYLISVGSQPEFASSLDRALGMATVDMVHWLVNDYRLEPWAAHLLVGYRGRYEVVTVAGSMALKIPKRDLPAR
jgi:amidase